MPSVVCPTCGEKGKIPSQFIGIRVKCKKCGNGFLVTPPAQKAAVAAESGVHGHAAQEPQFDGIVVDDLPADAWATSSPAGEQTTDEHVTDHDTHDESSSAFIAAHPVDPGAVKHYKLLTPKDKYFGGKFELGRVEDALNHYARQGWIVRSMATPLVAGFSGGPKEELVILLER